MADQLGHTHLQHTRLDAQIMNPLRDEIYLNFSPKDVVREFWEKW